MDIFGSMVLAASPTGAPASELRGVWDLKGGRFWLKMRSLFTFTKTEELDFFPCHFPQISYFFECALNVHVRSIWVYIPAKSRPISVVGVILLASTISYVWYSRIGLWMDHPIQFWKMILLNLRGDIHLSWLIWREKGTDKPTSKAFWPPSSKPFFVHISFL